MWISEPTPVISSTKVSDNGSMWNPMSICNESTGIHENRFCSSILEPELPETVKNIDSPRTKATITVRQPR